jgi:hypothetical protein
LIVEQRHGVCRNYRTESALPLAEIAAVQLLYSGYHTVEHTSAEPFRGYSDQYSSYEMNLLLTDRQSSRLHLCANADRNWIRQQGQRLAEFLSIPVVDQLCHGG